MGATPRFADASGRLPSNLIEADCAMFHSMRRRVQPRPRAVFGQPSPVPKPSIRSRAESLLQLRRSEGDSSAAEYFSILLSCPFLIGVDSKTRLRDCPLPLRDSARSIEYHRSDGPRQ